MELIYSDLQKCSYFKYLKKNAKMLLDLYVQARETILKVS